ATLVGITLDRLGVAMKIRNFLRAAAFILVLGSTASGAENVDREGISADTVRQVLRDLGYDVKIDTDDGGDPPVTPSVDGHEWQFYFYDCSRGQLEERRCVSFQFFVDNLFRKPVSAALINRWNKEYRWAKAYLQQGNEAGCPEERSCAARIEIDVLITGTA